MKTYSELKSEHQKEVNEFEGLFFAFSNEQFKEGMEKLGLTIDDKSQIYSIGAGGYIKKDKSHDFANMFERHANEMTKLKKEKKLLLNALVYELRNHEYCITYDPQDALDALGIKENEIDANLLKKAISIVMQNSI